MPDKQVRVDLVASDKASKVVEDLADEARELEKLDPEVEITADADQAERAIEDVSDEAKELTRQDQEIILRAKIGDAKAALKDLKDDLETTSDEARRTEQAVDDIGGAQGPRLAGNTVADLTGPLGDASGAASDLGGVFDGLGDLAEGALTRMGGNAAAMAGQVSQYFGLAGLAVAGLAAGWTFFRGEQRKAEEQAKQLYEAQKKVQDLIAEGDAKSAAEEFADAYGDALETAKRLGVSVEDATRFITGQQDELGILNERWIEAKNLVDGVTGAEEQQMSTTERMRVSGARMFLEQYDSLIAARDGWNQNTGAMSTNADELGRIEGALGVAKTQADRFADAQDRVKRNLDKSKDAMDRLRGSLNMERALARFAADFQAAHDKVIAGTALTSEEILGLKEDVLDVAEYADLNPIEVKSLLDRIEAGDYLGVKTDVEAMAAANPPGVETKLLTPSDLALQEWLNSVQRRINAMGGRVYVPGGGAFQPDGTAAAASLAPASSVVNVTQHVPRGYRGDLLGDARTAARRSGGLYHRNRR